MNFTSDELVDILAELGYKNVPHDQLRDFEKDLRRLIKHDEIMKRKSEKLMHSYEVVSGTSSSTVNLNIPEKLDAEGHSSSEPASIISLEERPEKLKPLHDVNIKKQDFTRESRAKLDKLKTDPVRLYHWYKTFWEVHNVNKQ